MTKTYFKLTNKETGAVLLILAEAVVDFEENEGGWIIGNIRSEWRVSRDTYKIKLVDMNYAEILYETKEAEEEKNG